jgi:hypothetical protein
VPVRFWASTLVLTVNTVNFDILSRKVLLNRERGSLMCFDREMNKIKPEIFPALEMFQEFGAFFQVQEFVTTT